MEDQNPHLVGALKDMMGHSSVRSKDTFDDCVLYGNDWSGDNVTEPPDLDRQQRGR